MKKLEKVAKSIALFLKIQKILLLSQYNRNFSSFTEHIQK